MTKQPKFFDHFTGDVSSEDHAPFGIEMRKTYNRNLPDWVIPWIMVACFASVIILSLCFNGDAAMP